MVFTIIATIGIISCSKEDNPNSDSSALNKGKLTTTELEKLQDEFKQIILSSEYIDLENLAKSMADALNQEVNVPFEKRSDFENWVTQNLSKTDFISVVDAMDAYDDLNKASYDLDKEYNSFYVALEGLEIDDILIILEPQLPFPNLQTSSTPCQNYCMDTCSDNIDALDAGYAANMGNYNTHIGRAYARIQYFVSITAIVDIYNGCMSSC